MIPIKHAVFPFLVWSYIQWCKYNLGPGEMDNPGVLWCMLYQTQEGSGGHPPENFLNFNLFKVKFDLDFSRFLLICYTTRLHD
jgi:hypothetical protein